MNIGIIAAMEQEAKLLVETLKDKDETTIANQHFYSGTYHNKNVVVVESGIGKVNAAIATSLLIDHFGADLVINSGSAGGIFDGRKVGDLVVSTELAYNDVDARAFGYQFGQIPQMPHLYPVNKDLVEMSVETGRDLGWTVHQGLILSGDSFIASSQEIKRIKSYFPEALVTEMEGTAVAQTCYQYGVDYIVIRAVSDVSDEDAGVSFEEFIEKAGKDSAALVLKLIENFK